MNNIIKRSITSTILILLLIVAWFFPFFMGLILSISAWYILTVEWPVLAQKHKLLWLLIPFYIIIPFWLCFILNFSAKRPLLFAFIAIVASFDTGSYVCGKLFGKHLLCPTISPNKTVEGMIGGFLITYVIMFFLHYMPSSNAFLKAHLTMPTLLLICILALCGDLFESWLKRKALIKDSGDLLPGHGGLLDRFDSYLWAMYGLFLIIQIGS